MKTCIFVSVLFLAGWCCSEESSYLENLSRKWLNGQKGEVRDIGYARIAANTNDIAGHILVLEYDVTYLNVSNILSVASRIQTLGESCTNTNFRLCFPRFKNACEFLMIGVASYPADPDGSDRQKASITNKPFAFGYLLKALQDDEYFH